MIIVQTWNAVHVCRKGAAHLPLTQALTTCPAPIEVVHTLAPRHHRVNFVADTVTNTISSMGLASTDLHIGVATTYASTRTRRYNLIKKPMPCTDYKGETRQTSSKFERKVVLYNAADAHSCTPVPAGTAPPAAGGAGSNPPKSSSRKVEAATRKMWQTGGCTISYQTCTKASKGPAARQLPDEWVFNCPSRWIGNRDGSLWLWLRRPTVTNVPALTPSA